tara:strand:- start:4256 stop:4756 length:501 start_codon:yes stop_codon:yes gene_type:complete
MKIKIQPKKVNKKNFQKFGDIISTKNTKSLKINNGFAFKYENLANINVYKKDGKIKLNIFKSLSRKFPLKIEMLEKHPLSTQTFFPIEHTIFLVVVAPPGNIPLSNKIESFIIPPKTGINFKVGIWHYPLISLVNSEFLVIERKGFGNNYKEHYFQNDIITINYAK